MKVQDFIKEDPTNIGRPMFWDLSEHITAIIGMIRADEIQIALKMCDDIPGWYRDHYPEELYAIKNTLYQQSYDQFDYSSDADEAGFTKEQVIDQCLSPYTYPRADILKEEIEKMNRESIIPWIFEISPSHGWLPVGFSHRGLKFSFYGKNLNQPALAKIKQWLPPGVWQDKPVDGQPKILVNYESLEHMTNPHDLEQAAKKIGVDFDQIYLSTPKYTLGGGLPNWDTRRLGHVRTWTPREFLDFANYSFKGYGWTYHDSHSMVLCGKK